MFTFGVLTSSDLGARGQREDTSGQYIRDQLTTAGFQLRRYEVVPDEQSILEERLRACAGQDGLDLILADADRGGRAI